MVNKNIDAVPDDLPDWLIPGSKAKLDAQRRQKDQADEQEFSSQSSQQALVAPQPSTASPEQASAPAQQAPELDWYISPVNKELYASIYESCGRLTDGTVTFPALASVVRNKLPNVSSSEVDKMWLLVNPQKAPSINKDPAVYLIHALKQKNDNGCKLPIELPHAIKEICNQQRVSYDLNSNQADVKRSSPQSRPTNHQTSAQAKPEAADLPVTEGTDWEVVKLRRQLAELDSELSHSTRSDETKNQARSDPKRARKELEELFNYRQEQISGSQRSSGRAVDVRGIKEDLDTIAQQVGVLEQFLDNKKQELQQLRSESQSLNYTDRA